MNYRLHEQLASESITTAGTKTIDLNMQDPISRLMIDCELTNDTYIANGHPADIFTKIEVLDGGDVLYSLDGVMGQAIAYAISKQWDHNELNFYDNGVCRAAISLYFGRWLWDESLALDPKQFNNLQLRIAHNYALGGCGTPSAATMSVHADLFDEKGISPRGFLVSKEHYAYTPAAGAAVYVDLPTDLKMFLLGLINTNDNEEPDVQFETVRIDEDDGKKVIYDGYSKYLIYQSGMMLPRAYDLFTTRINPTIRYYYFSFLKDIAINLLEETAVDTYMWWPWTGGRKQGIDCGAEVGVTGEAGGLCPHGLIPFYCGKREDIDDWWDLPSKGAARAKLVPRASSCDTNKSNKVITVQMRPY